MGLSIQKGTVNVTGSVAVNSLSSLPTPSTSQTLVYIYNLTGGAGTNTIYTVPGGYKFRMTGYIINNQALNWAIFKTDASSPVAVGCTTATTGVSFNSTTPIWTYASGEFIKFYSSGANHQVNILGYLEPN